MKTMLSVVVTGVLVMTSSVLTGCGTIGGAVQGAGEDLTRAGGWIRSK
jgi:predicted small secreted protein